MIYKLFCFNIVVYEKEFERRNDSGGERRYFYF